jgi:DNA-directed RNA polymerase sigma subunit (sigma70/sigma32)
MVVLLLINRSMQAAVANDKAWAEFMETLEDHRGVLDQYRKLIEKNKQLSQLTAVDSEFAKALEDYEKYALPNCFALNSRVRRSLEEIGMKAKHSAGRFKKKEAKSYFMQPLTAKTQSETIVRLKSDLSRSWNFLQVGNISFVASFLIARAG